MENHHFRIALYVDYIDSEYVQKLFKGAQSFFSKNDVELVLLAAGELCDHDPTFNYQHLSIAAHLTPKNFDGIIFVAGTELYHTTPEYARTFLKSFHPLPVVSIGYPFEDIPSVIPDCTDAMHTLVTHMIKDHHCKKIAFMGVEEHCEEAVERTRVFKETLEENNIPVDESLFMYGKFTYTSGLAAITAYTKKNPNINFDAIVALNDDMAYACIDFLRSKKIRVPEDVAVTGFDDLMRSSFIVPPLTSINQQIEKQGYAAASAMYKLLTGAKASLCTTVNAKAVFRQSCGCKGESVPVQNIAVAEWCEKSAQFVQAIHMYSNLQNEMLLDNFRQIIKPSLISMDIDAFAVCFYKTPISTDYFEYFPLPTEAYLLAAYDAKSGYDCDLSEPPFQFNPHEGILPKNSLTNLNGMFAIALFHNTVQYGYLLFRPGRYDDIVYNMVTKMFSNALSTAYNFTCAEQEKKKLEKEYSIANRMSLTDEMTGLLNRRGFISLGQKTLEVAEAIPQSGMVLYGDMDGLKKINDTYGHAAGDRAIKAEAQLLKDEFRNADIIGRLGGDEFAIVASGMTFAKFRSIKTRLYANCAAWNKKSGEKFTLSISIGYALFTPEMKEYNIKLLLEMADGSLYEEKNRKKSKLAKNVTTVKATGTKKSVVKKTTVNKTVAKKRVEKKKK